MREISFHDGLPARVFLLGFMGSGKSTLGPIIANSIGYGFIDLDAKIEQRHGTTIASLFNELDEPGFRAIETTELNRVADSERVVVSTGGGIVTVKENRRIIADLGVSVYLRLSAAALANRLRRSDGRPMLFGEDGSTLEGDELVRRIEHLMESRSAHYESADLVVDLDSTPVGVTVDRVVRSIQALAKRSI